MSDCNKPNSFVQIWPKKRNRGWGGYDPPYRDVLQGESNHWEYKLPIYDRADYCRKSHLVDAARREIEGIGTCARGICTTAAKEMAFIAPCILTFRQERMRTLMLTDEADINKQLSSKMGCALVSSHILPPPKGMN